MQSMVVSFFTEFLPGQFRFIRENPGFIEFFPDTLHIFLQFLILQKNVRQSFLKIVIMLFSLLIFVPFGLEHVDCFY